MNVAILGAGNIARCMATALNGLDESYVPYAIASRNLEKAQEFADKWHFAKAYGSYEELAKDPLVDLVYIATPHAMHHDHALLCMKHGKAVLVEKSFCGNAAQAKEVLDYAEEHGVFATEAIWTRYLPSRQMILDIMESGIIGEPMSIDAEFSVPLAHLERMYDPALAGGTLLDLGMYALTFASMFFGDEVERWESHAKLLDTGVDADDEITMYYADGKKAIVRSSMVTHKVNEGRIFGTKGSIYAKDLTNYSQICVYDENQKLVKEYPIPKQVNGYEYEVIAARKAIEAGKIQCEEMPHEETMVVMRWMDDLRKEWGVKYPFD